MFTIGDIKLGTFDCSFKNNLVTSFQGGLEVTGGVASLEAWATV